MRTIALFLFLALPAAADIIPFQTDANTYNNAYAITIDEGSSDIPSADYVGIGGLYGSTIIGFGVSGNVTGTPIDGYVTVQMPDLQAVQFVSGGVATFLTGGNGFYPIPVPLILDGQFDLRVFGGEDQVAFAGAIITALPCATTPTAPEPASAWLFGTGFLGIGIWLASRLDHKPEERLKDGGKKY